jgi:nicotinamidase-related amidase
MAKGAALLVLDMQNDIVNFHGKNEHLTHLIENIKDFAAWARSHDIPVIHSRVAFRAGYLDAPPHHIPLLRERRILDETQPGSWFIEELAPQQGDIVLPPRRRVDAFYNTDLEVVLRRLQVHTLLFTGMSTARVVESTARAASDRDYRAIILSDGCSADTREKHENALKSIADFFGQVMTIEAAKKAFA